MMVVSDIIKYKNNSIKILKSSFVRVMADYKYKGAPINDSIRTFVSSMLKTGRILYGGHMNKDILIHVALELLDQKDITDDMTYSHIMAHYASLAILNDKSFKEISSEYSNILVSKKHWREMINIKKTRRGKFYYSKHVTPELYKKYGNSILLTSKYYSEECFQVEGFLDDLILVDRPLSLPINNDIIRKVIDRMKYLISNHEEYWTYAAQELYNFYINRIYNSSKISNFDVELIKELLMYNDSPKIRKIIDDDLIGIPNIPLPKLAYILGIPSGMVNFCFFSPSIDKVYQLYKKIKQNSEDYYLRLRERNIQNLSIIIDSSVFAYNKCEICNTENLLGEDILDYNNFDILHYSDADGHIYSFTRDEFPMLVKRRRNPYNEVNFPDSLIYMMENRMSLNEVIGVAKPIKDHWRENGIIGDSCKLKDVYIAPKHYTTDSYKLAINKIEQPILNLDDSSISDMLNMIKLNHPFCVNLMFKYDKDNRSFPIGVANSVSNSNVDANVDDDDDANVDDDSTEISKMEDID